MKFHGSSPLAELGMAVIYMCGMQNWSPKGVGVRYTCWQWNIFNGVIGTGSQ